MRQNATIALEKSGVASLDATPLAPAWRGNTTQYLLMCGSSFITSTLHYNMSWLKACFREQRYVLACSCNLGLDQPSESLYSYSSLP